MAGSEPGFIMTEETGRVRSLTGHPLLSCSSLLSHFLFPKSFSPISWGRGFGMCNPSPGAWFLCDKEKMACEAPKCQLMFQNNCKKCFLATLQGPDKPRVWADEHDGRRVKTPSCVLLRRPSRAALSVKGWACWRVLKHNNSPRQAAVCSDKGGKLFKCSRTLIFWFLPPTQKKESYHFASNPNIGGFQREQAVRAHRAWRLPAIAI